MVLEYAFSVSVFFLFHPILYHKASLYDPALGSYVGFF